MNTQPELPISKDELAEAKAMLARGDSLAGVAGWIGCDPGALDLALWNDAGQTGPAPYAAAVSKLPRFGG